VALPRLGGEADREGHENQELNRRAQPYDINFSPKLATVVAWFLDER
jgi:hypothetical protein